MTDRHALGRARIRDRAQEMIKWIETPRLTAQPRTGSERRQAETRAITTSVLQAMKK